MKCELGSLVELKKEYPYTVYQPSEEILDKLEVGHIVKLLFTYDIPEQKYFGERMWVKITHIYEDYYEGVLDNVPLEAPIETGNNVMFKREHIYDTELYDPVSEEIEYYFEKLALVSEDVFKRREFNFLSRVEPHDERDTGWVIYSGYEGPDYEMNADNFRIIPIGHIFNIDDSVKEFFDKGPFIAYVRNEEGVFEEIKDYDWSHYYEN